MESSKPPAALADPILALQQRAKAAGVANVIDPAPVRLGTLNAAVRRLQLDPSLRRTA